MNGVRLMPCSDLYRNFHSILGLPVDVLGMDAAVARVYSAIDNNDPCFISTPNLNFLIASQKDKCFRQSIINSDLSLADGLPLVWIAKLLRVPLYERVAGSSLIEAIMHSEPSTVHRVKVFFFGGMYDVADQACEKLAQFPCGIKCVGSLNPGIGSIEEMSQDSTIEIINNSGAEFIIVSLGAKKGQAWIERNRHRLTAPVISHLGAVVNFIAGTVDRAPISWQRMGLEWLWRIKSEPRLWKRYFFDGMGFLKLLFTQILPYALIIHQNRNTYRDDTSVSISVSQEKSGIIISISGDVIEKNLQPVRDIFAIHIPVNVNVYINLNNVRYIDPCAIGLLLIFKKHAGSYFSISADSKLIRRILYYNGVIVKPLSL